MSPNPPPNSERFFTGQSRTGSTPKLTKQQVMTLMPPDMLGSMIDRIGGKTWVVVDREGRTVLQDPALRLPFHTTNKKFADLVAKESGGVVLTFTEALRVITDHTPRN